MASMKTVDEILALLIRTKPGMDRTMDGFQETVTAWHMVLEPLPDEAVHHAAVVLARSPDAFVNAGQLFDAALDLLDEEPDAEEAWKAVVRWARDPVNMAFSLVKFNRAAESIRVLPNPIDWKASDEPHLRRAFEAEYKRLSQEWRNAARLGEGRFLTDGKG